MLNICENIRTSTSKQVPKNELDNKSTEKI